MPRDPLVYTIVLNWNQRDVTLDCLRSVAGLTYANTRILLVDNGSTDGSVDAVRSRFPGVDVLALPANLGFSAGNNRGIQRALDAGADMVMLLNNDTTVDPASLGHLVARLLSTPRCGMVAPKICYFDNPDRIWYAGGKISFWTGTLRHTGIRERDEGQHDIAGPTDYATGCCVLVDRRVIDRIGMLDESYRMYTEDADWSVRARTAGFTVMYEPAARVLHRISVSSGGHLSAFKLKQKFLSNLRFNARHASWYHWAVFPWMNILVNAAAAVRYLATRGKA